MPPRPAPHDPLREPLALGVIAGDLAVAGAGAAPDWIKVTPRGPVETRDGRRYRFDPERLAARFAADGVEIPVDLDHALALRAIKGERVDAVGYAAAVEAREDGTYAKVNWLDGGLAVLAAGTHRYVSPSFPHDAAGSAAWLHSISLVAAPALSMPALLHALGHDLTSAEPPMKQIAQALGLPETADEAACLAALAARTEIRPLAQALGLGETADAAACLSAIGTMRGGGDLTKALQEQLATASARLSAMEKAARDREVAEVLDGALRERKILPAQREHYAALCATNEGLAGVKGLLAASAPGLQPSGLDGRLPEDGSAAFDPATLAAKAKAIQAERAQAGTPIAFSEAVTIASRQRP